MTSPVRWTRPQSLRHALQVMAAEPSVVPIAGGTDLMVLLALGDLRAGHLLDLWPLGELRGIDAAPDQTVIGALTTYRELATHPAVVERHPALVQAARLSGAWAIQNRGTLGGNLANASPAADSPPALLAYGARLELVSVRGSRWVDYADFHLGYKRTARAGDELIARIALAQPPGPATHFYRKVGTRKAQAISKVCLAGLAPLSDGRLGDVRLALGAVAPTVVLARQTAAYLNGRRVPEIDRVAARAILEAEIAPIDDLRSSAWYRRRVAGNLFEQFLDAIQHR
ncbi:MAG TPA: xanthine dehydrogenase family protein subunit M [Methylomirabilota bacterium]|nr:xanthine dehydrogenase family protein subunit M [Methylomirabilota bacterium]